MCTTQQNTYKTSCSTCTLSNHNRPSGLTVTGEQQLPSAIPTPNMIPTGKVYWLLHPTNTHSPQMHTTPHLVTHPCWQPLHASRTTCNDNNTHRATQANKNSCMQHTPIHKPNNPTTERVHLRIYKYQLEWLSEHNIQRSGFVRDLLDDALVDPRTNVPDNQTTLNDYSQTE